MESKYAGTIGIKPDDLPLGTFVVKDYTPSKGKNVGNGAQLKIFQVSMIKNQKKWSLVKDYVRYGSLLLPKAKPASHYGLDPINPKYIKALNNGQSVFVSAGFEFKGYAEPGSGRIGAPSAHFILAKRKTKDGIHYYWRRTDENGVPIKRATKE